MRHLEQRLVAVGGRNGRSLSAAHAVNGDGVDELLQLPVEARLHVVAIQAVDNDAGNRQYQQRPGGSGREETERERVEAHRDLALTSRLFAQAVAEAAHG